MSRPREWEQRFAAGLHRLTRTDDQISESEKSQNRATLARLRRGLGKEPGETAEVHAFVVPRMPDFLDRPEEDVCYRIASLFAVHQMHGRPGDGGYYSNLGASLAILRRQHPDGGASVERRVVAMLNSNADDLADHLRHAVRVLASADIRIDFAQLLRDVQRWDDTNRDVQREWSRAFWAHVRPPGDTTEAAEAVDGAVVN